MTTATYRTPHNPLAIQWDHARTIWLRDVPLAFGEVKSSRPGREPHGVMVRLDGSGASCGCEAGAHCTIEKNSDATAAAYWADWAILQPTDELERVGRDHAFAADHYGIDQWRRNQMDACADEIAARLEDISAA